jgi:hypothetical protein
VLSSKASIRLEHSFVQPTCLRGAGAQSSAYRSSCPDSIYISAAWPKVMLFDGKAVFTESFNFTEVAQQRNAENSMMVPGDDALTKAAGHHLSWT